LRTSICWCSDALLSCASAGDETKIHAKPPMATLDANLRCNILVMSTGRNTIP
jgi:hypothetical protein